MDGILELIKLRRISITTVKFVEDVAEYEFTGLEMKFKLNPDYVPQEGEASEFDVDPTKETEENDKEKEQ